MMNMEVKILLLSVVAFLRRRVIYLNNMLLVQIGRMSLRGNVVVLLLLGRHCFMGIYLQK